MNSRSKTFQDATESCLSQGAGILSLRSVEEENFLRAELEKINLHNMFYWLGMQLYRKYVREGSRQVPHKQGFRDNFVFNKSRVYQHVASFPVTSLVFKN